MSGLSLIKLILKIDNIINGGGEKKNKYIPKKIVSNNR